VSEIEKDKFGKGKVRIHQDVGILNLLGSRDSDYNQPDGEGKHLTIPGYRVQVFSGNDQRTSKDEAFSKERKVTELHSELSTYVTYKSPFWRVRVGDFRTYEEAYLLLRQLTKELPGFGREMYVIKEDIIIPL
jgi:hypothetical protein